MFTDVCPARTKAAMLLKMKITRSCPNNAKPHVGGSVICFRKRLPGIVLTKMNKVCPAGVRWDCKLFGQVGFVVGLMRLPKVLAIAPAKVYAGSRAKSRVVLCPCFTVTSFSVLSLYFGADILIV